MDTRGQFHWYHDVLCFWWGVRCGVGERIHVKKKKKNGTGTVFSTVEIIHRREASIYISLSLSLNCQIIYSHSIVFYCVPKLMFLVIFFSLYHHHTRRVWERHHGLEYYAHPLQRGIITCFSLFYWWFKIPTPQKWFIVHQPTHFGPTQSCHSTLKSSPHPHPNQESKSSENKYIICMYISIHPI